MATRLVCHELDVGGSVVVEEAVALSRQTPPRSGFFNA